MNLQPSEKPVVVITGSSGLIGARLVAALRDDYCVVGLDIVEPSGNASEMKWVHCDMTDHRSVSNAVHEVEQAVGKQLASVVHLAAYYDFSGEPSPLYQELTVEGTRRLLRALKQVEPEQFVFSSTLLVMKSATDDEPLEASSPLDAEWDYPESKLAAEKVIASGRHGIPTVIHRIAGVYDEDCHSLPIAQQIRRIYEKQFESYFFPGDASHGQAFIHLDDLVQCLKQTIEMRAQLASEEVFVIGEEDVMSYQELQDEIGKLIHGKEWPTIWIPKTVAKAGAWVKEQLSRDDDDAPFIKPWMIDLADQNYPVDIQRARDQLHWQPQHTLRGTLPTIVRRLVENPEHWYEVNGLPLPEGLRVQSDAGGNGV